MSTPVASERITADLLQDTRLPSKSELFTAQLPAEETDILSLASNRAARAAKYATPNRSFILSPPNF